MADVKNQDNVRSCYLLKAMNKAPKLSAQDKVIEKAYQMALHNLLEINTVTCPEERYNRTGLWEENPGLMIRAGGGYPTPWTRDAAVNTMNAACFLEPETAKNTLWAVCERSDGNLYFQMDNQSWDKIIWALGAWSYYLTTGDRNFLAQARETIENSLSVLECTQYCEEFGLFRGGSFFNDGITGYPKEIHEEGNESSFVGDHPKAGQIMALSTNCLYYRAYQILARIEEIFGYDSRSFWYREKAEQLKMSINRWLWMEENQSYAYFIYPDGKADESQEGCGLSFAILFDVCEKEQAQRILERVVINRHGMVSVWPPFREISSWEQPLRHNNLIWPFVNAYFAEAAAKMGRVDLVGLELKHVAQLAADSGSFYEIYHAETGMPDGGWQCGMHWESVKDQTWSATGFIAMIVYAVFGVVFEEDGISFHPCPSKELGLVSLKGLSVRGAEIDIFLDFSENAEEASAVVINGEVTNRIYYSKPGHYEVVIFGRKFDV